MAKAAAKKDAKPRAKSGARKSRGTERGSSRLRKKHTVDFRVCGARVVVDPGVVLVHKGDTVVFRNRTGGEVKLYLADAGVLKGVRAMFPVPVKETPDGDGYLVIGEPGVHECAAHYKISRSGKVHTGFAVGASSPKIIIQPVLN